MRPGTVYDLLGRELFDPDVEGLLRTLHGFHRSLWPYQDHADPKIAERALHLLTELGRAEGILGTPVRLRRYHRELIDVLGETYAGTQGPDRSTWSQEDLHAWLRSCRVHPDRLDAVSDALLRPADRPGEAPAAAETETDPSNDREIAASASAAASTDKADDNKASPEVIVRRGRLAALSAGCAVLLAAVWLIAWFISDRDPNGARPSVTGVSATDPAPRNIAKNPATRKPGGSIDSSESPLERAERLIAGREPKKALDVLSAYLSTNPSGEDDRRARALLGEIVTATSESKARATLRSLDEATLRAFGQTGKLDALDRVRSPVLREHYQALLLSLLDGELQRRSEARLAAATPAEPKESSPPQARPTLARASTPPRDDTPKVLHEPIEAVLSAPEKYEGRIVVPPGYFEIASRINLIREAQDGDQLVPLQHPVPAVIIQMREGGARLQDVSRIETDKLNFILDDTVARNFQNTLIQYRYRPQTLPKHWAILWLEIRRIEDGNLAYWAAVVQGMELLMDVKVPDLIAGKTGESFLGMVVTTEGTTFHHDDGLDWARRVGPRRIEFWKDEYRKGIRDERRRRDVARQEAELAPIMAQMWRNAMMMRDANQRAQESMIEFMMRGGFR